MKELGHNNMLVARSTEAQNAVNCVVFMLFTAVACEQAAPTASLMLLSERAALLHNATSVAPAVPPHGDDERRKQLSTLLTLISSSVSGVVLVFTIVLYCHYRHLHSTGNNVFVALLMVDLLAVASYFSCIFFVPEEYLESRSRCQGCGFIEQVVSFAEPTLYALFWLHLLLRLTGFLSPSSERNFSRWTITLIIFIAVISAAAPLTFDDGYEADGQAWCWISERYTWYRAVFCWMWLVPASVISVVALRCPFASLQLTPGQRRVILRRATIAAAWTIVNAINVASRFSENASVMNVQALFNPLSGTLNVAAFLFSERMVTLRALGIPADQSPPYGFTAAMREIADVLAGRRARERAERNALSPLGVDLFVSQSQYGTSATGAHRCAAAVDSAGFQSTTSLPEIHPEARGRLFTV